PAKIKAEQATGKPGAKLVGGEFITRQSAAELKDAIRSITVRAKPEPLIQQRQLEKLTEGWTRTQNQDGSVTYTRPESGGVSARTDNLESLKWKDLSAKAKALGLNPKGTKAQLIERIQSHDPVAEEKVRADRMKEASERAKQLKENDARFPYESIRQRLLTANAGEKASVVESMDEATAKRILESIESAPGDDP